MPRPSFSTKALAPSRERILVAAKAGDPLLMAGRARLIWAANTADALTRLSCDAWLTGNGNRRFKFLAQRRGLGDLRPDVQFRRFYGTGAELRVVPTQRPKWLELPVLKNQLSLWDLVYFLPRRVFPLVDAVHTRDFRIAARAVRRGIPTIYEDHNESFHRSISRYKSEIVQHPAFRLAIAPTRAIRDRMIERGIPAAKSMLAWSGLNERSLARVEPAALNSLRQRLLRGRYRSLVSYCGGLHPCRGVEFILHLAAKHPDTLFLILGGRRVQVKELRARCLAAAIPNVELLGYRPQIEIPQYLQAADAVLLPYNDVNEAKVTSPLKFFEYLAAGVPIVASRLPELRPFFQRSDLGIEWCGISDRDEFSAAFDRLMGASEQSRHLAATRIGLAAEHTWQKRQALVLEHSRPFASQVAPEGLALPAELDDEAEFAAVS